MKYYKSTLSVLNGEVVYANLPPKFVVGYEGEGHAVFQLDDAVDLPDTSNITEITSQDFNSFIEELNLKNALVREEEKQKYLDSIKDRERMIEELQQRQVSAQEAIDFLLMGGM